MAGRQRRKPNNSFDLVECLLQRVTTPFTKVRNQQGEKGKPLIDGCTQEKSLIRS
jgi:hypothetical protein